MKLAAFIEGGRRRLGPVTGESVGDLAGTGELEAFAGRTAFIPGGAEMAEAADTVNSLPLGTTNTTRDQVPDRETCFLPGHDVPREIKTIRALHAPVAAAEQAR